MVEVKPPSGKPWHKGKRFNYMSMGKKEILEKYAGVFANIKISEIKGAPILISRAAVCRRMEEIYNDQFQLLLKGQTTALLALGKVTHDRMKKCSKKTRSFFLQSLMNLMYSADKYGDHPEISQFLKFLQGPSRDLSLLYYLYLRQNFKILTYNSFFNHKKTAKDPLKIDVSYTQAMDIIEQAFYYDELVAHDLKKHMRTKVKPKQRIKYYPFLLSLLQPEIGYRDLELMNYVIALYNIKKPEFLLDTATLTQDMRPAQGMKRSGTIDGGYDGDEGGYDTEGYATGNTAGTGGTGAGGQEGQDGLNKWELMDAGGDEDFDGEQILGNGIPGFEDESIYLEDNRVIAKYKNKIKSEEVYLQKNIKDTMKSVVQLYIEKYKKENEHEELSTTREKQIYDRVYKKIYNLTTVIFYADRVKFFDLLRVHGHNKRAQELYKDMSKQYMYMKELGSFSKIVARDFIRTWLESPLVSGNILFFLGYEYAVPNPLLDDALNIETVILVN